MRIIGDKKNVSLIFLVFIFLFTALFSNFVKENIKPIFAKDLYFHDESSNSVVGANVYRQFFPPQIRLNPLIDDYKISDWLEAKYWMHIPPLFAYVPYPLYLLDGGVTIEMKRLSYALVTFLTALLLILIAKKYLKSFRFVFASFLAVSLWLLTPYTRDLVVGYRFGLSDIVLAFTTVVSFGGLAYYLFFLRSQNRFDIWRHLLIGASCALPFCAKNMLGLIPAATIFFLLLGSKDKLKKILSFAGGFLIVAGLFYLPLFFASPKVFIFEFMTSFKHFDNYEGWQRPWNIFFTDYLPNNYLLNLRNLYIFFALYILSFFSSISIKDKNSRDLILLSGIWFIFNLAIVSFVKSKAPNFVYSTYLFGLFFIISNVVNAVAFLFGWFDKLVSKISAGFINALMIILIFLSGLVCIIGVSQATKAFAGERANNIQSGGNAKFYDLCMYGKKIGWDKDDLVIIDAPNAYWLRFYVMFVTGAEGVHYEQMANFMRSNEYYREVILNKYKKIHFVKLANVCANDPLYLQFESKITNNGYTIYSYASQKLSDLKPISVQLCD